MARPTRQQIINALNNCLTPLANSVAAYLLETEPYTTANDKDAMGAIQEIAASDKKFEHEISEMILELEGIPQIGSVDPEIAELNYLSFPYLLDVMIEREKKEVARYKPLPPLVPHYPDVRRLFQDILKAHEGHLEKLQGIRKNRYKSDEPEEPEEQASETVAEEGEVESEPKSEGEEKPAEGEEKPAEGEEAEAGEAGEEASGEGEESSSDSDAAS